MKYSAGPVHAASPARRLRIAAVALPDSIVGPITEVAEVFAVDQLSQLDAVVPVEVPLDLIICTWDDACLRWLQRTSRAALIVHFGPRLPDSLLEVIALGFRAAHASTPEELRDLIDSRCQLRSDEQRLRLFGGVVRIDGIDRDHELIDVSNDGFAFVLHEAEDVGAYLVGTPLQQVELRRGAERLLSGIGAHVKHVSAAPGGRYRIGCEIVRASHRHERGRVSIIRDRATCAGLLRAALRARGVRLERLSGEPLVVHCADGAVNGERGEVSVDALHQGFRLHDVIRGQLEVGDSLYRFESAIVGEAPLRFTLPTAIEQLRRRGSARFRPALASPILARLHSPFAPGALARQVHDASSTGLSFDFDPAHDLFPLGMHVPSIELQLGTETVCVRGRVTNITPLGNDGRARCGIELEGLSDAERGHLAELIVRQQFLGLGDGGRVGFDEMMQFFRDSRFLTPQREQASPLTADVQRTFEALAEAPSTLFKSVVFREGERIVGHISSVRSYRRTYSIQHLAAAVGRQAGLILSLGNAEYLMHNLDFEFIKMWFHAKNLFPSRIFGGFARKVFDPALCTLRRFGHVTLSTAQPTAPVPGVDVIEASGDDLAVVERYFVANEAPLLVRADDLTRNALALNELHAQYRTAGLQRRRRVLIAFDGTTPLGFALLEVSSPGLNLFEALSRFQLFVLPEAEARDGEVRRALVHALLGVYRLAGRTQVTGLVSMQEKERAVWEALGMALDADESMCLTCHRSQLRRFAEHMEGMAVRGKTPAATTPAVATAEVANR
jgi:hypothetical protein